MSVSPAIRESLVNGAAWPFLMSMARRTVAVALLVVTLPVWFVTGGLVVACVGRPLLFRQTRCGLNTLPFTLCKFRTMHDLRDSRGELLPDVLRQTRLTATLRRFRLDELPQLLSIAAGDMAFLGPRPLLPASIAGLGDLGRLRCSVLPGLSGWAQVNGNTRLSEIEKLALDLWYIKHRSLLLDCRILAMTMVTLFLGERRNEAALARARDLILPLSAVAPERTPR